MKRMNGKRKNKASTRKRESRVDKKQDSQIQELKRQVRKLSKDPRPLRTPAPRKARAQPTSTASGPPLSEPTQRCLVVGTDAHSPEAKGAYIPVNTRNSIKYDTKARERFTLGPNCSVMIAVHPCPNSDAPSTTMYKETTAGAFSNAGNTFGQAGAYTNVSVTQHLADSMYTFASTDWDNASVRYVGCGIKVTNTGAVTSRVGHAVTMVRHGGDPILAASQATDLLSVKAAEMNADYRLVSRSWQKSATIAVNHLHEDATWPWCDFNRTATNTLASNMVSQAYACAGGSYVQYGQTAANNRLTDPVILMTFMNTTTSSQLFDLSFVGHFERSSDDFARQHTPSQSLPHEIGDVFSALRKAHADHASDPDKHIATHVQTALSEQQRSKASGKRNLWATALRTAEKPQNEEMAASLAMMLI